jgi:hypothetical protein
VLWQGNSRITDTEPTLRILSYLRGGRELSGALGHVLHQGRPVQKQHQRDLIDERQELSRDVLTRFLVEERVQRVHVLRQAAQGLLVDGALRGAAGSHHLLRHLLRLAHKRGKEAHRRLGRGRRRRRWGWARLLEQDHPGVRENNSLQDRIDELFGPELDQVGLEIAHVVGDGGGSNGHLVAFQPVGHKHLVERGCRWSITHKRGPGSALAIRIDKSRTHVFSRTISDVRIVCYIYEHHNAN